MFNPFKLYVRWRHSKGFGVHSPYAYMFIKEVVRPGNYGYYAYDRITPFLSQKEAKDPHFQKKIRFTIRMAIFLKAKRIVSTSESSIAKLTALALSLPFKKGDKIDLQANDLMIIQNQKEDASLVEEAIRFDVPVLALNPDPRVREKIEFPRKNGLLLSDFNSLILIPRKDMHYTSYPVNLLIG